MSKQIIILSIFLAVFYCTFSVAGEFQPNEEDSNDLPASIISKIEGHELHILKASTKVLKIDKTAINFPALLHNPFLIKAYISEIIDNAGSYILPLSVIPIFFCVLINAP